MHVNGKIVSVEIIPRMVLKENDGRGEFKHYIFDIS
jgi:hypothetical protein